MCGALPFVSAVRVVVSVVAVSAMPASAVAATPMATVSVATVSVAEEVHGEHSYDQEGE